MYLLTVPELITDDRRLVVVSIVAHWIGGEQRGFGVELITTNRRRIISLTSISRVIGNSLFRYSSPGRRRWRKSRRPRQREGRVGSWKTPRRDLAPGSGRGQLNLSQMRCLTSTLKANNIRNLRFVEYLPRYRYAWYSMATTLWRRTLSVTEHRLNSIVRVSALTKSFAVRKINSKVLCLRL